MSQSLYDKAYNIAYVRARDKGVDPTNAVVLAEEEAEEALYGA